MGKGPPCKVCNHKDRHAIEIGLANGLGAKALGRRFGLHYDAIARHRDNHLPPTMRAAIVCAMEPTAIDLPALQESESRGLLASLVAQRARLQVIAGQALDLQDSKTAVAAENSITSALALTAKVLGLIINKSETRSTSILISADYLAMRAAIVAALRPYPQAARAVGEALAKLETAAATEIAQRSDDPAKAMKVIEHDPTPYARDPNVPKRPGPGRPPKAKVAPAPAERASEPRTTKATAPSGDELTLEPVHAQSKLAPEPKPGVIHVPYPPPC